MPSPKHIAIASCTPQATRAGQCIAEHGGNAFDVALAVAFNLMVSNPLMCSLSGGGFATLKTSRSKPQVLNFFSSMPGKGLPPDRFGQNLKQISLPYGPGIDITYGHATIGVPGTGKGLHYLYEHYASLPLDELLAPSIADARQGVPLNKALGYWISVSGEHLHW